MVPKNKQNTKKKKKKEKEIIKFGQTTNAPIVEMKINSFSGIYRPIKY